MSSRISAVGLAGTLLLATIVIAPAQQHGHGHHGHGHHGQGSSGQGHQSSGAAPSAPHQHGGATTGPTAGEHPSVAAFRAANDRMHRDMDIRFTGNADADFVRGMIPHHQGAIDMAKVVLEHGKDEQVRKWAADIIREQEREIAEMRGWLTRHGHN
ncbi:MAG: DUF305 domain-containing protein [Phreatobacter sp.]|uniref:CopM family metallochaperone n=1 Tax=Phreatobacter sp. TaxID=1966341 RepID=UPI002736AF29|nr:DUF305 domain-containing protein [Phreatobacter sp.]MDP2803042.1 DUF305 domain-containing protein [Phreatobacter sp.]